MYAVYSKIFSKGIYMTYSLSISDYLKGAVNDFTEACITLHATIQEVVAKTDVNSNENVVRIINDKLTNIEKAFIHDGGLPGRPYFKWVDAYTVPYTYYEC